MRDSRFTTAALVLALIGCVVAFVGPLALDANPGARGSITLSAVVAAVFAGKNWLDFRDRAIPRFAAAVMATALGAWLIVAPLRYESVADPLIATAQFGGMLVAAFSAYTALVALEAFLGDGAAGEDGPYL